MSGSGEVYLALGGELRLRYEHLENNLWGEAPVPDDGYLWYRAMLMRICTSAPACGSSVNSSPHSPGVWHRPTRRSMRPRRICCSDSLSCNNHSASVC
ncbi:MAG: hypothetical protein ACREXY_07435 [Gammaproteobacteria bacterium]